MRGGIGTEEKICMTGMRQMGASLDGVTAKQPRVRFVEGQDTNNSTEQLQRLLESGWNALKGGVF